MKKNLRNVLLYLGIPIIFIITIVVVSLSTKNVDKLKYYEIVEMFEANQISEYQLNLYSGELVYEKRGEPEKKYRYTVASPTIFVNEIDEIVREINDTYRDTEPNKMIKKDYKSGGEMSWLASFLPTLLVIGVFAVFWIFFLRRMNGSMGMDKTMSFGKAKIKKADPNKKTTFIDVAGADEEKQELEEIVDFLKNP